MQNPLLNRRMLAISLLMAIIASTVAYGLAVSVYQKASLNADENSYAFQAHTFLDGQVVRPFPPNVYAFRHKMIITDHEVGWLSRYPFAHPLFLVPGLLIGDPHLWVAVAAGLSLLFVMMAGVRLGGWPVALSAGILLLLSPFFHFYHGTLLSHSSGLLAVAVMFWAYIRLKESRQLPFALASGLAWAFLLNNRTYTALLIAVPFAVDALVSLYRDRSRKQLYGTVSFALSALLGVLALFVYNRLSVGEFMEMTYLRYSPEDGLGFGSRRFGSVNHTFERGWGIMLENLQLLNLWLFGFRGSVFVWLGLAWLGWKKGWTGLALSAAACVILGYIYFWYRGPTNIGPSYYFEVLPFIVLSAAFGIVRIVRRIGIWPLLALALLALVLGLRASIPKAAELRAMNAPRRAILDAIAQAPERTLIFIHPAEHREAFADGNDMIFNPRGLDGDVVVAHWMPDAHKAMVRYFADYEPVRLVRDEGGHLTFVPMPEPDQPFSVHFPVGATGRHTGTNIRDEEHGGRTVRWASAEHHPAGFMLFGRYHFIFPGPYLLEVELRTEGDVDEMLKIDLAADFAAHIVAEQSVKAGEGWRTLVLGFEVDDFMMIEPRIWFGGTGTVSVASLQLRESIPNED